MKRPGWLDRRLLNQGGPCPQWKWAKTQSVVHCTCERTLYRGLRIGPHTAYHDMVLCTTNLALVGTRQLVDPWLARPALGKSGGLVCVSIRLAESAHDEFQTKKRWCSLSYWRSFGQCVALWAGELAPAFRAQFSLGYVVDSGRKTMAGLAHRLALVVVVVAGHGRFLAGTRLSTSVASRTPIAAAGTAGIGGALLGAGAETGERGR